MCGSNPILQVVRALKRWQKAALPNFVPTVGQYPSYSIATERAGESPAQGRKINIIADHRTRVENGTLQLLTEGLFVRVSSVEPNSNSLREILRRGHFSFRLSLTKPPVRCLPCLLRSGTRFFLERSHRI